MKIDKLIKDVENLQGEYGNYEDWRQAFDKESNDV